MLHTGLVLGDNWSADEWPESVDVMHEGVGDRRRYVPERIERIEDSDLPETSPLPGIPRIRVYDKDGRKCAEGYYVFHERRQPAAYLDELKPEDCAHCVVFDESADWNMPKMMCRKVIVPDGGWIEVVSDVD